MSSICQNQIPNTLNKARREWVKNNDEILSVPDIRNISHVMSKNSSFLKNYPKNKKQKYSENLNQDQSSAICAIKLQRMFQKL